MFEFMNTRTMTDKFQEWQKRATEAAKNASNVSDRYVRDNTWKTVAFAAILGCMVGYFLTHRD
jgi:ElaB/YqjD/DUF883 family membrane-anchored ribosome-binding protein